MLLNLPQSGLQIIHCLHSRPGRVMQRTKPRRECRSRFSGDASAVMLEDSRKRSAAVVDPALTTREIADPIGKLPAGLHAIIAPYPMGAAR
jgi:hypothetical protein